MPLENSEKPRNAKRVPMHKVSFEQRKKEYHESTKGTKKNSKEFIELEAKHVIRRIIREKRNKTNQP